jgi:hypothetical protein
MSADVTHELERGYWPSYNVPYFPQVYERAGYPAVKARLTALGGYAKVVSGLTYQLAPRAKLFRRDAGSVDDLPGLAELLRGARWKNDSYSGNDVWGTLCARGDLDAARPVAYGCMDVKVTSHALAMDQSAWAVSGPSTDAGSLAAFSWSKTSAAGSREGHRGMIDTYNGRLELQHP